MLAMSDSVKRSVLTLARLHHAAPIDGICVAQLRRMAMLSSRLPAYFRIVVKCIRKRG